MELSDRLSDLAKLRLAPIIGLVACLPGAVPALAQTAGLPPGAAPGAVLEQVATLADTAERYALYLPSGYRADRTWPVLYLLDPGGRALVPLRLFRPAAERYGYVILSSSNSRSDSTVDPTARALAALFAETERRYAAEVHRLYLAGFSGTARQSWTAAYDYRDNVAGVMGFGAGLPYASFPALTRDTTVHFVFFGGAGLLDFNYDEVRALDAALRAWDVPHRIRWYGGRHAWPPEEVCTAAVEWMELQAMRRGLAPRRVGFADSLSRRWLAEAQALESAGELVEAEERYRAVMEDLNGLSDVSEAAAARERLNRSPQLRRAVAALDQEGKRYQEYLERLEAFRQEVDRAARPPALQDALRRLMIAKLLEQSEARDTLTSLGARRLLENALVRTGGDYPREYLARSKPAQALLMLDIAQAIRPEDAGRCRRRAQALTQMGKATEAAGLACAP